MLSREMERMTAVMAEGPAQASADGGGESRRDVALPQLRRTEWARNL
jgi:hypothetical protein